MPADYRRKAEWERLGYDPEIGSAIATLPPPIEFLRVFHLTTAEFAISDIAFSRLKVATFADLNDPFELVALDVLKPDVRKLAEKFRQQCEDDLGLLCFSADWTSPALWGHYAAKHSGVCLGFNLKKGPLVEAVKYEDKRIKVAADEFKEDLQHRLLYTKFEHWRYEKEHRVVVRLKDAMEEGGLHFYPFNPDFKLAEVILGHRCSLAVDEVRKFAQSHHPDVITYQARPAYGTFHLVPLERTVL